VKPDERPWNHLNKISTKRASTSVGVSLSNEQIMSHINRQIKDEDIKTHRFDAVKHAEISNRPSIRQSTRYSTTRNSTTVRSDTMRGRSETLRGDGPVPQHHQQATDESRGSAINEHNIVMDINTIYTQRPGGQMLNNTDTLTPEQANFIVDNPHKQALGIIQIRKCLEDFKEE